MQEEGALVIALRDYSQEIPSPGVDALPPRSTKRRRIQLLPGSASIIQPYPCTAGTPPLSLPTQLLVQVLLGRAGHKATLFSPLPTQSPCVGAKDALLREGLEPRCWLLIAFPDDWGCI